MAGRGGGSGPPTTSAAVRERLEEALRLDLIGPGPEGPLAEEELPGRVRPSNWYLAGFLVPQGAKPDERADDDAEDDSAAEVADRPGLPEESAEDLKAAKRAFFPSSMGLSFLVPPEATELAVAVSWGEYERTGSATAREEDGRPRNVWRRTPRRELVRVRLGVAAESPDRVPNSEGLTLHRVEQRLNGDLAKQGVPSAARAVSLFLVNEREPPEEEPPGASDVFQTSLEVRSDTPFVGRPDPAASRDPGWDERVAKLHYADRQEYATGHGVSADWEFDAEGSCHVVRTTWIPRSDVEKVEAVEHQGPDLSMRMLGSARDREALAALLRPLVDAYRSWIRDRRSDPERLDGDLRETAEVLVVEAERAAGRIAAGIELLSRDPEVRDAFQVANRAVGRALQVRRREADPKWRTFQMGFFLLNLVGLADPEHIERRIADLLFFPTGGGKTEAYLGLAAFAMVLRRLRNPEQGARAGAGVSVVMRYTLRLLTFDQLGRAAGLVCALELEREKNPSRYGEWPFEIGLWVGKAATPNEMGRKGDRRPGTARDRVHAFQREPEGKPVPVPISKCPWCRTDLGPRSFSLRPNADAPRDLRIVCANTGCEFTRGRPLPIVAVDEPLYRRLPAFLVATVDKFAALPWRAEPGALLGGPDRWDEDGFYGVVGAPRKSRRLPRPLPPPDLVVQDELHLISGPLGTMAGLYEAAISGLCRRKGGERGGLPKLVASTATANRASEQVQALFGRSLTATFPPPGPERNDSFFARTRPATEVAARRYLGVAAPGRSPKVVMRRVLLALAGAAQKAYDASGGKGAAARPNPADPYLTQLVYFNALRELGGGRRIVEEEVQNTLRDYRRRKRVGEESGLFANRQRFSDVLELTSRVPTGEVARTRDRLDLCYGEDESVAWVLATNMISVGLDIQRLGLLVVVGQPKLHSEYIQATSRVGRDHERPGLVVSLLNVHKPRDRSHYERFRHYHETFYRSVEAVSVTPFAARALDRGFAGAFVALARHFDAVLTPPLGAARMEEIRMRVEHALIEVFTARVDDQPFKEVEREERLRSVRARSRELLDGWTAISRSLGDNGIALKYNQYEKNPNAAPLLRDLLDRSSDEEHQRFRAGWSLRDVEPEVPVDVVDRPASRSAG